jgi:2-polyprenyl-3-methyl-5-hydroxy-6-metoxy-1,4-benzoquinol methylase
MKRAIKLPNVFILVGQPDNGKTTLSNWFEKLLGCEVIHTDQVYHAWIEKNHPKEFKAAKRNIRGHYPTLPSAIKRSWNEYLLDHILTAVKRAKLDLVVEGWLLLYLPQDLKAQLDAKSTTMTVQMRHYTAHAGGKSISPAGRDYTNTVNKLCKLMSYGKGINFMRNLVKYQSFEDIRDFQGTSDSCGKLLSLNLPQDLTGKTVLDVGCGTGYFTIRCAQRGATTTGIDSKLKNVIVASRLSHAIYRLPDIRFYKANFTELRNEERFDYIIAVGLLPKLGPQMSEFMCKAHDLLRPGGKLIVELPIAYARRDHPKHDKVDFEQGIRGIAVSGTLPLYPTERALLDLANGFRLTYRGRSVRTHGTRRRMVYHLEKPSKVRRNTAPPIKEEVLAATVE